MDNFSSLLKRAAKDYGLNLTDEQIQAMDIYFRLLIEWNQKINLTAITEPHEVAIKHMIDSISCYQDDIFTPGTTVVDVGTGAGFPGIPLKIFRPDLKLTLVDSLNKRLLFLREVVDQLHLEGVDIVHARAEDAGVNKEHREKYQVVVSRAVARLNVLCELCLPFVKKGGYFVALKGAQYEEEVSEATNAIRLLGGQVKRVMPVNLPEFPDRRAVIYIQKAQLTPAMYPRRAGTPEKKPL